MEKLKNLLNEFESKKKIFVKWNIGEHGNLFQGNFANTDLKIISKRYGFIKWLVDNDKIDLEELTAQAQEKIRLNLFGYKDNKELDTDLLLMLLSIQDNPIDFLISILK